MVLQQRAVNVIWGNAAPKQTVEVVYKNLHSPPARASKTGQWRAELDLTPVTDYAPAELSFNVGIGKRQHLALVLTNVVVGDVWLFGVIGRGVPPQLAASSADLADSLKRNKPIIEHLRLITISSFSKVRVPGMPEDSPWHPVSASPEGLQAVSSLAYHWALQLSKGYVGVVQGDADELGRGLRPSFSFRSLDAKRTRHCQELADGLMPVYDLAKDDVVKVQRRTQEIIAVAAEQGIVTNIPPVVQYAPLSVHVREEFEPKASPAEVLTFDAAIW